MNQEEFIKKYGDTARKIIKDWKKNPPTSLSELLGKDGTKE